jgi:hypothetical protein
MLLIKYGPLAIIGTGLVYKVTKSVYKKVKKLRSYKDDEPALFI